MVYSKAKPLARHNNTGNMLISGSTVAAVALDFYVLHPDLTG